MRHFAFLREVTFVGGRTFQTYRARQSWSKAFQTFFQIIFQLLRVQTCTIHNLLLYAGIRTDRHITNRHTDIIHARTRVPLSFDASACAWHQKFGTKSVRQSACCKRRSWHRPVTHMIPFACPLSLASLSVSLRRCRIFALPLSFAPSRPRSEPDVHRTVEFELKLPAAVGLSLVSAPPA